MRRTMFVVPLDLAAVMDAACTRALGAGRAPQARRAADAAPVWPTTSTHGSTTVEAATLAALRAGGPLPASQLTKVVPDLARQLKMAVGTAYEGTIGVSTRVLFLLAAQGRIARARPLGSWLSSQYRWVAMEDWIGPLPSLDDREARAELTRRWLRSFGPATVDDLAWWAKWTKADVQGRARRRRRRRRHGRHGRRPGGTGVGARRRPRRHRRSPARRRSRCSRRSTRRSWAGSTGRGTSVRTVGRCSIAAATPGRPCGSAARPSARGASGQAVRWCTGCSRTCPVGDAQRIATTADRLTDWMDGVRVTPRFPTPLDRELASS